MNCGWWMWPVAAPAAWLPANTVIGSGYQWLPDSRGLVVFTRPANLGPAPAADGVPTGPAVQQTSQGGGVVSIRTYQDLLKNEADARQFDYYATTQPMEVGLDGSTRAIGAVASSWASRCRLTVLRAAPAGAASVLLRGAGKQFSAPH